MSNDDFDLRAKIDCLSRPETYLGRPLAVEAIETHFAWVFLAGKFVYKMKKPFAFRGFDLTTLTTRRVNCELEVALNRRLAPAVYIGTVPLSTTGTALLLERLAQFYATTPRAPWDGRQHRRVLAAEIERSAHDLAAPAVSLDEALVGSVATGLEKRLEADAHLHQRIADGRVVDAHGDLRPEIVLLALECERLGDTCLGARVLAHYSDCARDKCERARWYLDAAAVSLEIDHRGTTHAGIRVEQAWP